MKSNKNIIYNHQGLIVEAFHQCSIMNRKIRIQNLQQELLLYPQNKEARDIEIFLLFSLFMMGKILKELIWQRQERK